jgi:hypothetical protein
MQAEASSVPTFDGLRAAMTMGNSDLAVGLPDAYVAPTASDAFSYIPGTVSTVVGKKLEMLPVLDGSQPRVFAIAPDLPRGLTLDMFTGLIHGVPMEATDTTTLHFVTACEPLVNLRVRTAAVRIAISSLPAPAPGEPGMPAVPTWMPNMQRKCEMDPEMQHQLQQVVAKQLMGAISDLRVDRQ